MNTDKITICIPAYKCKDYLDECLASIFKQSYQDFRILLCFDFCKESMEYFKKSIYYNNPKICAYITEAKSTPYIIRNTLWQTCSGRVLFFDSDDIMEDNCLETLSQCTADIVYFRYMPFKEQVSECWYSGNYARGAFYTNKKIFDTTGGFREWLCSADGEFLKRVQIHELNIEYNDNFLMYYRNHLTNLSISPETGMKSEFRKQYRDYTRNMVNPDVKIETVTTKIIPV